MYAARKVLGWSTAEFFAATPRFLDEMMGVADEISNPKKKIIKKVKVRTAADFKRMP